MDPVSNPYSMGAGNPPPELAGRDAEIEAFRILIGRLATGRSDQSMILSGLRGVGKTVLLLQMQAIAAEAGWLAPDVIEARPDASFLEELNLAVYQAIVRLDRRRKVGDALRRLSGLLRGLTVSDDGTFTFDAAHAALLAPTMAEHDLVELFTEIGQLAREHGTGIALFVDEMQFLERRDLESLAAAMHRLAQRRLPLALVGAGLPQLPGQLVGAKSYAERLFAFRRLDRLTEVASTDALAKPAGEVGVTFEPEAIARAVALSGRYPAFIQAYGKEIWNTAPASPITVADVDAAGPIVVAQLDEGFFHVRFERATAAERAYMSAMATLGDGPVRSSDVARALGHATASRVSKTRDALIRKGLAYSPDHGTIAFSVPEFASFMRRRYPASR